MQFTVVQRVLGLLIAFFSLTLLPPIAVSLVSSDGSLQAFSYSFLIILSCGLLLWWPVRHEQREFRLRDGFIVVVMFWISLGLSGAVPLLLVNDPDLGLSDAVFESISGLTTTGATVLTGIDQLPISVQYYRQQLQWLGGMGIIVLAVAIFPMLGIGGMQLYRAEIPGPMKDSKLTPRITETAKVLWYIYFWLTVACTLCYWAAGMSLFDAICHSFSTVSIGGFSTHDTSIGFFQNPYIEYVAVLFMFLAGINFSLHFLAWNSRSPYRYLGDSEFRAYCRILSIVCLICILYQSLFPKVSDHGLGEIIQHSVFQSISITTTTGYVTSGYATMPGFLPILLLLASFIGSCAGSTGGGLKVIRIVLLYKQGVREIRRLVHPNGVFMIKLGGQLLPERIIEAVWGYLAAHAAVFVILLLAVLGTGLDELTAFSAVSACLNNLGPGLGAVSQHYGDINTAAKWILCLTMLLGRLEIFTLLVILSPVFWKR